jgi:CHAT domain-containing protein/tetratricopeptide (TPR) repeat protein
MAEHGFMVEVGVVRRLAALAVVWVVCGIALGDAAQAQGQDDLARLHAEVIRLQGQGKYAQALPIAQRYVELARQKHGDDHPAFAIAISWLGAVYRDQGRLAEAEPLLRRSLAINEKALGPLHPEVGASLNGLARLYWAQGRYADAEALFRRGLAIHETALGPDHPHLGAALSNLATLYRYQGRYAEAEPLYRRGVAIVETALGREHPNLAAALGNLASLYQAQGRYEEAEPLLRRSLAIAETALGPEHPSVGLALNNLALLYQAQGRYGEAEPLHRRSLAIRETALGREHPDVAVSLNNLGGLYQAQGRYGEAGPLYRRSLDIRETALGREHPVVAESLNNLALLYLDQGRYAEAEPLHRRSLAIIEPALGREHPKVATVLNNLAYLYQAQGRYEEAEPLLRRSLAIAEAVLGREHPDVVRELNNLAFLELARSDWARAADYWQRSTGTIVRRTERGLASAAAKGEAQQLGWQFAGLVKMTHRLAAEGRAGGAPAAEMFETAQWALASEAAASLAQMAARSAAGSPPLAGLVRERQDLVGEWQAKDKLLVAAKSQEPARRNAGAEKGLADRLGAVDSRLADIGRKLAKDFPDYAALASPAPVSVAGVQAQLGADEALVLFLDTDARFKPLPEETFVWVVTRTHVRWVRSDLGTAALNREVAALRCGLDNALWGDKDKRARCVEVLEAQGSENNVLPFPVARAHALYKALLGEVEDLIAGKHLLIVPSGALTQLPFQVLVTMPPKATVPEEGYRKTAWLGARQPITVLPAVSSLKALRAHAKASRASKVYLGIGNPLLDGRDPRLAELAKKARAMKSCPVPPTPVATLGAGHGGVAPVEIRGGLANVADLRTQAPLPETADELCTVARDLKANVSEVRLGDRATETDIKALSKSGELARYRVLHFATHGAMAGELSSAREPGLILTPPDKASEEDDGYLSASEIGGLKIDADWVILSACNTAAGRATSAEALSGLARAFFYAGARALLVSHWAVDSTATVKLITTAAAEMARDARVGRAEAMRRAMLALIQSGTQEAHPSFWAPFAVVGEGAASK